MLKVTIPETELFDNRTSEFIVVKSQTLTLEHSLVSISKWESKWHVPFIGDKKKTSAQSLDYIRCMTLTQNVDPLVYRVIPNSVMQQIRDYIDNPMTATWFSEEQEKRFRSKFEVVTSELIYYWMIASGVPFECQKWHLNRLLTLLKVCGEKNKPQKKMSKRAIMERNARLNAQRRAAMKSKG